MSRRHSRVADPELNAIIATFALKMARITDAQVAASFVGGADPAFLSE